MEMTAAQEAELGIMPSLFMRSFPLEDIHITRSGDGRTVEAYAAVFDVEAEIQDFEGHYNEVIDRTSFNRAISHAKPQGQRSNWNVGVFYNHGMTIHGTPSDRGSMPIGTPVDIRAESRGLLTVTRYNNNPLAEETLEAIRSGSVRAQSFTGRIVRSTPALSRAQMRNGGHRATSDGTLTTVRRMELGLREYGPTPMPAYQDAAILGVRSISDLRALRALLAATPELVDEIDDLTDPVVELGTAPNEAPAADNPPTPDGEHLNRHTPLQRRIQAALRARGVVLDEAERNRG
jgi:HK97 family phage prohead protease